jgi:hypothetical protein
VGNGFEQKEAKEQRRGDLWTVAGLVETGGGLGGVVVYSILTKVVAAEKVHPRHCEERSDAAIHKVKLNLVDRHSPGGPELRDDEFGYRFI